MWPSSPACTWHCSLHYHFLQATSLFPRGMTIACPEMLHQTDMELAGKPHAWTFHSVLDRLVAIAGNPVRHALGQVLLHLWHLVAVLFCSVAVLNPRLGRTMDDGPTFSIYLCPLSFWLTLPRRVLSTSWCCPSRPCVAFLACVHLALFLALTLSPAGYDDTAITPAWTRESAAESHSQRSEYLVHCSFAHSVSLASRRGVRRVQSGWQGEKQRWTVYQH